MNIILLRDEQRIQEASALAYAAHCNLAAEHDALPARRAEDFAPRIQWLADHGTVYGLEDEQGSLRAFLGWFPLENFRNLGPGALTPDWGSGIAPIAAPTAAQDAFKQEDRPSAGPASGLWGRLFRRALSDMKEAGLSVHGFGVPATSRALIEELSLSAYGRIVLDAARTPNGLLAELDCLNARIAGPDVRIRRAGSGDAPALAALDEQLALHIGASPVLMPDTHGSTAEEWAEWLAEEENAAYIAELAEGNSETKPVGFIKAGPPQFDVSWFVHGETSFAICGMYVDPPLRGLGVAGRLLAALAEEGAKRGKTLMTVDCETHNPEARAFWLRFFHPVSWTFERRF